MMKQFFRRKIRNGEYEFYFCNFACTSIIKLFKLCLFSSQSSSCPSFMLYTTTSLLAAKLSSCCWLSALSFSFNRASLTPAAAPASGAPSSRCRASGCSRP